MGQVELWVRIVGDGISTETPYRPDLPEGIKWGTDDGAPSDLTDSNVAHAVKNFNVLVDEKDIPKIEEHLKEPVTYYADGDDQDVMTVDMVRAIRSKTGKERDDAMGDFCDAQAITAANKQMVKDVLVHAVTRGVSVQKAEEIISKHDLPEATAIGL